jgi:hypothetical protein
MAKYYIYLPVNDLQLVKIANDWKKDSNKDMEVIVRESQGFKKAVSRTLFGGILKNVAPNSTLYVLAHGFSAGQMVSGPEAEARSILSTYGGIYTWLQKRFPAACTEWELQGYADASNGSAALEAALDDDASYSAVVKILAGHITGPTNVTITVDKPGAIRIGGTRPDGSTKTYSASQFFSNLTKETMPQVAKLKIFACNTGITAPNETSCFAEQLYGFLRGTYPNIRVFGYLGATKANYSAQNTPANGQIPANASDIWNQFHVNGPSTYTTKKCKGARMVQPAFSKVVAWGSSNQDFVPAHVLRVEFPGGQSVTGDMKVQENEAVPF